MKLGHVALLLVILTWTGWYLSDAVQVSTNVRNLILIVPTATIVLLAVLFELLRQISYALGWIKSGIDRSSRTECAERKQDQIDILRGIVLLGMLGILVFSMSTVGFDVGVFAFLLVSLIILDRRNILGKLIFAAGFTFVVIGGARSLLPFPMHTIIL
jgi:hypothetical protein